MLQLTIAADERWDESKQEFVYGKEQTLQLEHSLVSLSKWESKWHKSFLSKQEKTYEESIDYIRCMTITKNVDPSVYERLSRENIEEVDEYISASMTATHFRKERNSPNGEPITAELIYYWMIAYNIPFECQKWHLSRLLTLIRVCNIKSTPPKKRSNREIMAQNTAINAARRKQLNTKG